MSRCVVVVEDDSDLRRLMSYHLGLAGYAVHLCADRAEAERLLRDVLPDIILLDWMLPGSSGVDLCRYLRGNDRTSSIGIIMVTARGSSDDLIYGLSSGADDYIVKPFSFSELSARMSALLRRSRMAFGSGIVTLGDLVLDCDRMRLTRSGCEIGLSRTEFKLLEYLMSRPGRVLSRGQLLDAVWGDGSFIDERTVDVHIGRLRRSLSLVESALGDPIRTVRGLGYSFSETYK